MINSTKTNRLGSLGNYGISWMLMSLLTVVPQVLSGATVGNTPSTIAAVGGVGTGALRADNQMCSGASDPTLVATPTPADTIVLTWTGGTTTDDCNYYEVYRGDGLTVDFTDSGHWLMCIPVSEWTGRYADVDDNNDAGRDGPDPGSPYTYQVFVGNCWNEATSGSNVVTVDPYTIIAATLDTDHIDLAWTSITDATSYKLEYNAAGGEWTAITPDPTTNSYAHSDGTPGTSYQYRVRAVISSTEKSWSNESEALVFPGSFTCSGTAATLLNPVPNANGITLAWTGGAFGNCSSWHVYRGELSGALAVIDSVTTETTRTFQDNTAVAGTGYRYVIALTGGENPSADTTEIDPYTVIGATAASDRINVTWTSITNAGSYKLQYRQGGGNWTAISPDPTTNSFAHTDGFAASNYRYRVRAVVNSTEKSWSNVVGPVAFPGTACTAPSLSSDGVVPGSDGITVSWTGGVWGTECDKWVLERRTGSGPWEKVAEITSRPTRTYHDNAAGIETSGGPMAGTQYEYRVSAQGTSRTRTSSAVSILYSVLTATASATSVDLSWTSVAGATGYDVERKDGAAGSFTVISQETANSYVDNTASAGTYTYRILPKGVTPSSYSTEQVVLLGEVPGQPARLRGELPGGAETTVLLEWEPPAITARMPVAGYRIQYGTNSDFSGATDIDLSLGDRDLTELNHGGDRFSYLFTLTGLNTCTEYHVRVRATNILGAGDPSNAIAITTWAGNGNDTCPGTRPGAVTNLAITVDKQPPAAMLTLSWTAAANATDYVVQDRECAFKTTWRARANLAGTSYTDESPCGRSMGDAVEYRVAARNAVGYGPWVTVTGTLLPPIAVDAPTNLRFTRQGTSPPGDSILDFTWDKATTGGEAEFYFLQRANDSTVGGSVWQQNEIVITGADNTMAMNVGVPRGTTVFFRVVANNHLGSSNPANIVTVTTAHATSGRPSAPRSVSAQPGSNGMTLSWQEPADTGSSAITTYRIESSTDGGTSWTTVTTVAASLTTYLHTNPPSGQTLHYRIIAINAQGDSPPSAVVSARGPAGQPSAPRNLSASATGTTVNLAWDPPDNDGGSPITGYKIDFATGVGGAWGVLVANTGSTSTTYVHPDQEPGARIRYRVSAINAVGTGPESGPAEVVIEADVPGPPTGVGARAQDHQSVVIEWSPPVDDGGTPITGYLIEVSTDGADWQVLATDIDPDTRSYVHTNLEPATTYHYRVLARNEAGISGPSEVARTDTDADLPGTPTAVMAVVSGAGQIDLSWQAPAYTGGVPITGYRVEYSTDAVAWREAVDHVETDFYQHTGLLPSTKYYYRVYARNQVGLGEASRVVQAETDADLPGQPTDLGAIAISRSEILLGWSPPPSDGGSPITGYRVERSEDAGVSWTAVRSHTGTTNTAYRDSGLTPGATYRYRVSAINEVGAGPPSEYAEARTHGPPDAPGSLVADAVSPNQINLRWSAPGYDGGLPVTEYLIEYSPDGGGSWEVAAQTSEKTYGHRGLRSGTTYRYRVSAINAIGVGEPSPYAEATTHADVPDPPHSLAAVPSGHDRIDLQWQAPGHDGGSEITGYSIEVSADEGATWRMVESSVQGTRYIHRGLEPATTYTYRASAINAIGTSEPSNIASATTFAAPPSRPRDLVAEAAGSDQVNLRWLKPERDGGSPITGYQIEVSEDQGSSWQLVSEHTGSTKTSYEHTDLTPATTYRYRVAAINDAGKGELSREAEARTAAVLPEAPRNLTAEVAAFDQIDLAWEPPAYDGGAPVTAYVIEASTDEREWERLDTVGAELAYSHTGAAPGVTWSYRVSAVNEVGIGPASDIASALIDDPVHRADRVNEAIMPWFAASATSSSVRAISTRIAAVAKGDLSERRLNLANGRNGLRGLADGASVAQANNGISVWATADLTGLGNGGNVEWDGETFSVHAGLDGMLRRDILVGLAANRSSGSFDFTDRMHGRNIEGQYDANVTSITPYVAWVREDVSVWSIYGPGWGSVMIADSLAGERSSRLATSFVAMGGMKQLAESPIGAFGVRAEGWNSSVEIAGNLPDYLESGQEAEHINSSALTMRRARLMLDWSAVDQTIGRHRTEAVFRAGMRQDWNNVGKGLGGTEVGGELRFESPGFRIRGDGRMFVHPDYREWGVRGMIELRSQSQHGLSVQVNPSYGSAGSGIEQLWNNGVGTSGQHPTRQREGRLTVTAGFQPRGSALASHSRFDLAREQFVLGTRIRSAIDWLVEGQHTPQGLGFLIKGRWTPRRRN